jgi:hypothetical protein
MAERRKFEKFPKLTEFLGIPENLHESHDLEGSF